MPSSTSETAQWFAATSDDSAWGVVFPTALGWIGIVWKQGSLHQSTFGQDSAVAAARALGLRSSSGERTWHPIDDDRRDRPARNSKGSSKHGKSDDRRVLEQLIVRLQRFATHFDEDFADVALALERHTAFQRRVLEGCRAIPPGQTLTYQQLATVAGSPGASRAVGNVMASNQFAPIVPCHRVVGSGGGLGGYSAPAGLALKKQLLAAEAAQKTSAPARRRRAH